MRKIIIALSLVTGTIAVHAQQALQCANPDVLNALVYNARAESKLVVSRELPADPAGFRAPAGFTLIGSGVRGQGQATTVAYKTTLATQAAFEGLLAHLSAEGWRRENTLQPALPGISVAGAQPTSVSLCRNGERRNVQVREVDGVRYATIAGFETMPPRACDAPNPLQFLGVDPIAMMNARNANLPQLSFPATARMGNSPLGGGNVSGNSTYSTTTRIESPDTAASLARHLARQLSEQGWRSDAEWNGKLSSGSTWSRRNAQGQALGGMLEILSVGEGAFDVGFTLTMRRQ